MEYLNDIFLDDLKYDAKELFEDLSCACGKVIEDVRPWLSDNFVGIEARSPCDCGRGKTSVSIKLVRPIRNISTKMLDVKEWENRPIRNISTKTLDVKEWEK